MAGRQTADIVFCMDASGSMSNVFNGVRNHVNKMLESIKSDLQMQWDVRFDFLAYSNKDSLERLKTVILEGQFGVAENGSIWIDDSNFPNRLIPFITEELVLCLDAKQIVRNMHEAYLRTDNAISGFGVFISGPSKTSDIEQHLVYGAHGAKKLVVIISHQSILE